MVASSQNNTSNTQSQEIFVQDIQPMAVLIEGSQDTGDTGQFELGDLVKGQVISIDKNKIVVDLNNVATGVVSGSEMVDSGGMLKSLKIGDEIETVVIGSEDEEGQLRLSLKRAKQESTWDQFVRLFKEGGITKIKMREANKGGLLIELDGIRGFLPVSQLTPEHYPRVEGGDTSKILSKLERLVGQDLTVKVINVDEVERRIIVSEKAAYEEQRKKILIKLRVGEKIKGIVSGVVNFGIFVNYEGVEGLVHISEIAWGHVADPKDYAKGGDQLEVLVIGVDGEKVSFSMKRLTADPWVKAVSKYNVGQVVGGPISRITPFGAFIRLDNDIEGLIHISELSADEHVTDPAKVVNIGQEVKAQIIGIEPAEHRLGLSIKALMAVDDKDKEKTKKDEEETKEIEAGDEVKKEVKKGKKVVKKEEKKSKKNTE